MLKIYSKRWNAFRGAHWAIERDCNPDNVQDWLKIFRADEPGVVFVASKRRPPLK